MMSCGIVGRSGRECARRVPDDAPMNLCAKHLAEAHAWFVDVTTMSVTTYKEWTAEKRPNPMCHVYYLRFGDRIKIGTSSNWRSRVRGIPHDEVLAVEPGGYELERKLHAQFNASRISGEWFRPTPELAAHIAAVVAAHGEPVEFPEERVATA